MRPFTASQFKQYFPITITLDNPSTIKQVVLCFNISQIIMPTHFHMNNLKLLSFQDVLRCKLTTYAILTVGDQVKSAHQLRSYHLYFCRCRYVVMSTYRYQAIERAINYFYGNVRHFSFE